MKKIILTLCILSLLILTACNTSIPTGKGVSEIKEEFKGNELIDEKIQECINSCSGEDNTEEIYSACYNILYYGGEDTFNNYVEACK